MQSAADLTIAAEPFDSADAQRLIADLNQTLAIGYLPEQQFGRKLQAHHLAGGRGIFFVARANGEAVGCGGLLRLDDRTAEVKRMYVDPEFRGQRIGARILGELEAAAARMNIEKLVLETGIHQEAAIGLYLRAGFARIPCWGEYAASATSVCFERRLKRSEMKRKW